MVWTCEYIYIDIHDMTLLWCVDRPFKVTLSLYYTISECFMRNRCVTSNLVLPCTDANTGQYSHQLIQQLHNDFQGKMKLFHKSDVSLGTKHEVLEGLQARPGYKLGTVLRAHFRSRKSQMTLKNNTATRMGQFILVVARWAENFSTKTALG